MAPVQGDPALVEQLRFGVKQGDVDALMGRAARCWDRYGLPDGSRNPGRQPGRLPNGLSGTLIPSEKLINESLNKLLRPVLEPADRWLLSIPRVLVPDRSSAHVLVSRKGAAIGMPWSAFGALFFANALSTMFYFAEEHPDPADRTLRGLRQRRRLARRLPRGLCATAYRHWLTGMPPPAEAQRAVDRLEAVMTLWMKMTEPYLGQEIWAVSVFQQALMVLHEFGHVVDLGGKRPAGSEPRSTRCTLADELGADTWSHRYARRLSEKLFSTDIDVVVPLLDLFSTLDMAELPDPADPRRGDLAERCARLIHQLSSTPIHADGVNQRFLALRARADRPEKFLLTNFRDYDDFVGQFARGGIKADTDGLRAVVDDLFEPWL